MTEEIKTVRSSHETLPLARYPVESREPLELDPSVGWVLYHWSDSRQARSLALWPVNQPTTDLTLYTDNEGRGDDLTISGLRADDLRKMGQRLLAAADALTGEQK